MFFCGPSSWSQTAIYFDYSVADSKNKFELAVCKKFGKSVDLFGQHPSNEDQIYLNRFWFEEVYKETMNKITHEMVDFFTTHWYTTKKTGAYQFREDITMYKPSNTNMLLESFYNTLKTRFFIKKINRRADRLLYRTVTSETLSLPETPPPLNPENISISTTDLTDSCSSLSNQTSSLRD